MIRVRQGFDDDCPELSVPKAELDAMHPAHRQDILDTMSKFALGTHLDEGDLAHLFRTEGMSLSLPSTPESGRVDMTVMLGEVVLIGAPEDVAALQADNEDMSAGSLDF